MEVTNTRCPKTKLPFEEELTFPELWIWGLEHVQRNERWVDPRAKDKRQNKSSGGDDQFDHTLK